MLTLSLLCSIVTNAHAVDPKGVAMKQKPKNDFTFTWSEPVIKDGSCVTMDGKSEFLYHRGFHLTMENGDNCIKLLNGRWYSEYTHALIEDIADLAIDHWLPWWFIYAYTTVTDRAELQEMYNDETNLAIVFKSEKRNRNGGLFVSGRGFQIQKGKCMGFKIPWQTCAHFFGDTHQN